MANQDRNSLTRIAFVFLTFTSFGKGAYEECVTSLRNTVVYEGTMDTILNCPAGPNGSAWDVKPTSRPIDTYHITNYSDMVSPNLMGLYAYNQSGLIVLNATTTPTGGPISTAGIYFVKFINSTDLAAKLVVIRSGPTCSYSESASDGIRISCNITYADHQVAPIYPIMNCTINGQLYTYAIPPTTAAYSSVRSDTLTITANSSVPATYDCKVTFSSPAYAAPYPYLAMNAPDFSAPAVAGGPSTTVPATITTSSEAATSKELSSTTSIQLPSTSAELTSLSSEPMTTISLAFQSTTGSSEAALLSLKIALGTVVGILMAAFAVAACSWCCPPLVPFRTPSPYVVGDIQPYQRRDWIPLRKAENRNIPFYQQSFSGCGTYEYRLPSRNPTIYEYRLPSRNPTIYGYRLP